MRQTMLHIPDALIEAARIDGASEPRIYVQIILPLLWPAVLTLALFVWRETWDAFVWPLLITSQDALRTVPIGLQRFSEENVTNYNEVMAMSFVAMLPLAILFFIFQRAFIQGIAGTGIKAGARIHQAQLGAGGEPANRAWHHARAVRHRDDRAGLGQPVALADHRAREDGAEPGLAVRRGAGLVGRDAHRRLPRRVPRAA